VMTRKLIASRARPVQIDAGDADILADDIDDLYDRHVCARRA
jgi:hypothetical protein